ncbi:MAG: hypothetical protein ACKVZJ_11990 [Phycisphaerales bacterium]
MLSASAIAQPAAPAAAQPPQGEHVLVVQSNLKVMTGRLTAIDAQNAVTLIESAGAQIKLDAARVLALIACDPAAQPELGAGAYAPLSARRGPDAALLTRALLAQSRGALTTSTGERYLGELAPTTNDNADRLTWSSPSLGNITISLDAVSMVRFPAADEGDEAGAPRSMPRLPPPGADDAVVLENADTFRGLITRVGDKVELEPQEGGAARSFDRSRVAAVVLANPTRALSGPTLFLADGSVLRVSRTATERSARGGASLRLKTASEGEGVVPLNELRAWTPAAEKIVPLSSLTMGPAKALPGRVFAPPPALMAHADDLATPGVSALNAQDIVFLSGVETTFELPPGATHLIGTAALEDDALEWGDCEAVVSSGPGIEPVRLRLSAEAPAAAIAARVTGPTLTVRIEPGRFGTVKDKLRLMRPLVVIGAGN